MAEPSTDVMQGTLDLLLLKTLSLEPMHGFGIARRIEQLSDYVFRVNPGSLLLAFSVWSAQVSSTRSGVRPNTIDAPNSIA